MAATSIFYTAKSVRRQPPFSPLDKSRRTFLGAFLTLIILTSACAVFYIGTHVQAVNLGYKIGQELQKKEHLIEENKRLDLEIARLKSPTRIEEEAKEVFGLVLPKTQQVYYLSRWDEDLNTRLAAAPEKTNNAKPETAAASAVAKPQASTKTLAKAPEKAKVEKAKLEASSKTAKALSAKPASETPKTVASAKASAKPVSAAVEKPLPKVAAKTVPPPTQPSKVTKAAPSAIPQNSDVEKSDLPVKALPPKALAQNNKAPAKTPKPRASVPATAKNEPAKPAKGPALKPSAETKLAKKEEVLVARIVEKAPVAEKSAKPKAGPALAYQTKEKVPAVMLDPMP